jgi:hypothetical protein
MDLNAHTRKVVAKSGIVGLVRCTGAQVWRYRYVFDSQHIAQKHRCCEDSAVGVAACDEDPELGEKCSEVVFTGTLSQSRDELFRSHRIGVMGYQQGSVPMPGKRIGDPIRGVGLPVSCSMEKQ